MPITLLSLKAAQIASELTLTDFDIFSSIEPQEYIFDIFEMKSDSLSGGKLMEFEALSNKEMFWVINEIVNETNLVKRVKIIKYFIKTANICRNVNNYNSMFAILSGLCHTAVRRLKTTWEKLNTKYHKILKALQLVCEPTRNMVNYRRELSSRIAPIIPLYPIVKKDLTFINLAHLTIADDGLVNFDKMRMISKEIRSIMNMSSQPYLMPSVANLTTNALNNTQFSASAIDQQNQSTNSNCPNKNCTLSLNKHQNQRGLLINLQAKISEITGEVPCPAPPPTVVSSNVVAAKRIFEENFMKKKVRNYLELCFAKISYDEEYLISKSHEIEPSSNPTTSNLNQSIHSQSNASIKSQSKDQLSINTGSTTTVNSSSTNGTTNKQQGSPTLSSTSSGSSSCRLKMSFGAESPNQYNKLMSLREDDSSKSTKSNLSLSSLLNYNHHHQHNNHHFNNQVSLNNGRFNVPNHGLNSNQQFNNNLNQHQLNNNFTHSQSSNHLRNANDSLNSSNNILMNTVSFNAPLSYESSSVTSLRHLEQVNSLHHFDKFRKQHFSNNPISSFLNQQPYQMNSQPNNQQQPQSPVSRPPLPDYLEAVTRKQKLGNYNTIGRSNNSTEILHNNQANVNRNNRKNQDQDKVSAV